MGFLHLKMPSKHIFTAKNCHLIAFCQVNLQDALLELVQVTFASPRASSLGLALCQALAKDFGEEFAIGDAGFASRKRHLKGFVFVNIDRIKMCLENAW